MTKTTFMLAFALGICSAKNYCAICEDGRSHFFTNGNHAPKDVCQSKCSGGLLKGTKGGCIQVSTKKECKDKPRRLRGLQRHMKGNYTEPSSLRGRHLDSCGTFLFMKTCASDNDCCTSSGWTCGQDKKCGWIHFPGASDKMNTGHTEVSKDIFTQNLYGTSEVKFASALCETANSGHAPENAIASNIKEIGFPSGELQGWAMVVKDRTLWFVFRGSKAIGDWLDDIKFFYQPAGMGDKVGVEKGFYDHTAALAKDIDANWDAKTTATFAGGAGSVREALEKAGPIDSIRITGHSLGGSVATLVGSFSSIDAINTADVPKEMAATYSVFDRIWRAALKVGDGQPIPSVQGGRSAFQTITFEAGPAFKLNSGVTLDLSVAAAFQTFDESSVSGTGINVLRRLKTTLLSVAYGEDVVPKIGAGYVGPVPIGMVIAPSKLFVYFADKSAGSGLNKAAGLVPGKMYTLQQPLCYNQIMSVNFQQLHGANPANAGAEHHEIFDIMKAF